MNTLVTLIYLVASVLFILGLKRLTRVKTARSGNQVSAFAMFLAVIGTLLHMGKVDYGYILAGLVLGGLIGLVMAKRVQMTAMPEMVAIFNGFGGAASALVAISYLFGFGFGSKGTLLTGIHHIDTLVTVFLSILIGSVTFTGSLIAFGKLNGKVSGRPIIFPGNQFINGLLVIIILALSIYLIVGANSPGMILWCVLGLVLASSILGVLLVIPIGGADMPVVIALLNSYSGLAASATGFVLQNNVLIICGALVGASGLILTQIMCKAMNRSLTNVLFGGFGQEPVSKSSEKGEVYPTVKACSPEEAAMIFESAREVIIVPGYGLAVAQAQHATKEMADLLTKNGARVRYAIHPVAGRMPGHMNVLLAESNVPHEQLCDMDDINDDFQNTDAVIVLGANDVVNPAAMKEKDSPIFGMPVLKVWEAKSVFVVKRSLSAGFAAIPNDLFNYENNLMLFGDAKKILSELNSELKELLS